jgi:hypothetical protein
VQGHKAHPLTVLDATLKDYLSTRMGRMRHPIDLPRGATTRPRPAPHDAGTGPIQKGCHGLP